MPGGKPGGKACGGENWVGVERKREGREEEETKGRGRRNERSELKMRVMEKGEKE